MVWIIVILLNLLKARRKKGRRNRERTPLQQQKRQYVVANGSMNALHLKVLFNRVNNHKRQMSPVIHKTGSGKSRRKQS
jgi:hypothetical protein